jgi:NitT/TauT family transport system permease protein
VLNLVMTENKPFWQRAWGEATALLDRTRRVGWVDLLVLIAFLGLLYGLIDLARQWTGAYEGVVEIDLSPLALPRYAFFSLCRGLLAYSLSLAFTLVYGYWAAKDRVAERVLIPVLDILQSIPILSFLPGLILGLQRLFPTRNIGLELASILTIFTGQAWNMTFSFYHSLKSIPQDQREVAILYRFNWWQAFKWLELPFAMVGLVWNSMMSMAGGWFFLAISEAFSLGDRDFRLPGLGSYMKVAVDEGRWVPMVWAIVAMAIMIVALDQLLWRPIVVWAQKFRVEESGHEEMMSSWFLNLLRRSQIFQAIHHVLDRFHRAQESRHARQAAVKPSPRPSTRWAPLLSLVAFVVLLGVLLIGTWQLLGLLWPVTALQWGEILVAAGMTLGRVLLALALGTVWALPAGLAIGLSPRLSRMLQPVVQVVASFPASMLYPLVLAALAFAHVTLGWGSIFLMLLGTQWYILFNVIAGAMAIPADLREAAASYRIKGWQRFRILYLPAVFPQLVTGWVTAAGGAWNTSIIAEYVSLQPTVAKEWGVGAQLGSLAQLVGGWQGAVSGAWNLGIIADQVPIKSKQVLETWGLGAEISRAYDAADFPLLAASILVLAVVVVGFNSTVWRYLYGLASTRFNLTK